MPPVKPYSILPHIYEHLMRKIDYGNWADYIVDIACEFEIEKNRALELGAGNCKIAGYVDTFFDELIVSDYSVEMLRTFADQRNLPVCFDMRKPAVKQKFDLIFSAFDTVNYLLTEDDFLQFLSAGSELLNKNGILTFDASMPVNSQELVKRLNRQGKYSGYTFEQTSEFDSERMLHINRFKIVSPSGEFFNEEHIQKIFSFNDYFKMFDETDLFAAGCFDAFTFEDADENSARVQFVLKKRKNDQI